MPMSYKEDCDGYLAELSMTVVFQRDILPFSISIYTKLSQVFK